MSNRLALIVAAIQAILAALVLLEVLHLTDDQLAGIMAAINAVMLAVAAWFEPSIPVGKTGGQ